MKSTTLFAAITLLLLSLAIAAPAQAQNRMQTCAAEWKAMKASNQTGGKTYREFQKSCMAKPAAGAAAAAGSDEAKASKPKKARKSSPGRDAAVARQRACAAEWKADKAAGKVAAGMKWPQYWSACNKRMKATPA